MSTALSSLDEILSEVRTGDGMLNGLIYSPVDEESLVAQANAAAVTMNSILAKLDEGEGTLGLLINDPTLFEDMQVLLGGAKRSALLRSMIRMAVEQEEEEP